MTSCRDSDAPAAFALIGPFLLPSSCRSSALELAGLVLQTGAQRLFLTALELPDPPPRG